MTAGRVMIRDFVRIIIRRCRREIFRQIQSAELIVAFVSKLVRTRIALIPALCPQWTTTSLSPTKTEDARSTLFSLAPANHSGRWFGDIRLERRGHQTKIGGAHSKKWFTDVCRSTRRAPGHCSRVKQPRRSRFGSLPCDQFESSRLNRRIGRCAENVDVLRIGAIPHRA